MNRELRRLQAKEEKRQREARAKGAQKRPQRERVGLRQFFAEVRQELKRVAWPSRKEVITFTVVTLIVSAFVTVLTFGLDIVFKRAVLFVVELR